MNNPEKSLSHRFEEFFGSGRCFALAKGRVALYAGLRAMELRSGGRVLMPGYTCVVVPAAVRYAGLVPAYADIDPRTYNLHFLKKIPILPKLNRTISSLELRVPSG
jgi:dTDP-4-amino-4,6-dideoxygalactose transaminase